MTRSLQRTGRVPGQAPDERAAGTATVDPAGASLEGRIRLLQRTAGNRAVARMLSRTCACGGESDEECQCEGGAEHEEEEDEHAHGGRVLARAGEFAIEGLPGNAAADKKLIFFQLDKADISDPGEQAKIPDLALPTTANLTLRGTASEEGPSAHNTALAKKRIDAVSKALRDAGHIGTHTRDETGTGEGDIDYRRKRSVEVIPAGSASSEPPDCDAIGTEANDCGPAPNPFSTGLKRAEDMLTATIDALKKVPLDAPVATALDTLFGGPDQSFDAANLTTIQDNLGLIKGQLANLVPHDKDVKGHQCVNNCDASCRSGAIAHNEGEGPDALMSLCPIFVSEPDLDSRAGTLMHEASHGTAGLNTDDRAYDFQRLVGRLPVAGALKNADSYTGLVRTVVSPGSITLGRATPDDSAAITDPTENAAANGAIAWLEQWLIGTQSQVAALYGEADKAIKSPTGWQNTFYEARYATLAPLFGLSVAAVPREKDKEAIAGIADRYQTLFDVTQQKLTLRRLAGPDTIWDPGPGDSVSFGDTFFTLGAREQVDHLLEALIAAFSLIPPARSPSYIAEVHDMVAEAELGSP